MEGLKDLNKQSEIALDRDELLVLLSYHVGMAAEANGVSLEIYTDHIYSIATLAALLGDDLIAVIGDDTKEDQ